MNIRKLFKKQNKNEVMLEDSTKTSVTDETFSEEDFKRKNNNEEEAEFEENTEHSILTKDIERPITLNTNLSYDDNMGKIEDLSENDLLDLYKDKPQKNNLTPNEKLSNIPKIETDFQFEEILDDAEMKEDNGIDQLSAFHDEEEIKNKNKFQKKRVSFKNKAIIFGSIMAIGTVGLFSSFYLEESAKEIEASAVKSTFTILVKLKSLNSSFKNVVMGNIKSEEKLLNDWDLISREMSNLNKFLIELNNKKLNDSFQKIATDLKLLNDSVVFSKKLQNIAIKSEKYKQEITNFDKESSLILKDFMSIYNKNKTSIEEMGLLLKLKESLSDIYKHSNSVLNNVSVEKNMELFNQDKEEIKKLIIELAEGNKTKGIRPIFPEAIINYNDLATKWNNMVIVFDDISKDSEDLLKIEYFKNQNDELVQNLADNFSNMSEQYNGYTHHAINLLHLIAYLSILLLLIAAVGIVISYKQEMTKREQDLIEESNKNKKAILKLLNEMSYLQNGDLTQKTTVEEGITINIADSINATIDSLAVIVRKIQNSSSVMKDKTKEINEAAENLMFSTENQSNSILEVNESIVNMSKAINAISEKTKVIMNTSEESSRASLYGVENVNKSISAMSSIDKNMDETVMLMNKVSDSSRQISDVIELLSDITEETNVLALNASVQAAKAGNEGKGFKIVADAIHELADKAAEATRKVASLIANVQTDIQSVGLAVNKTTEEVQGGVKLSESVGLSLKQISDISLILTETIKKVSEDVNTNAIIAKQISQNMENILNITEETRKSARNTTMAISEIDKISSELTSSVKTFIVNQ